MKKDKQKIEYETLKTLEWLDKTEQISCGPYFEKRLEARIKRRQEEMSALFGRNRLQALLMTALCLLILLVNMGSALWIFNDSRDDLFSEESYLTVFAEEYSLNRNYPDYLTANSTGE